MTPRRRTALVVVGVLLAGVATWVSLSAGSRDRPDIVLIVWDTSRGDRVSVNGYPHPTTPRLAELAARGVTFRRCFTPSPWTPPAHASLFTGLLPRRHGLREGKGDRVRGEFPLLAQTLSAAGYETVSVSANTHLSPVTGLLKGFRHTISCWSGEGQGTSVEVRAAVEGWIAGRKGATGGRAPYFLFVNLMDSHLPYHVEEASVEAVRGTAEVDAAREAGRFVTTEVANGFVNGVQEVDRDMLRGLGAAYDGALWTDDRATGGILDALGRAGLLGNAVVVVVGDHGENLGEHRLLNHLLSVNDTVLHVPLVMAWPGRFEGGGVEDSEVRLQDLYPTLLAAAGIDVPAGCGVDARSLLERPLRSRTAIAEFGPYDASLPDVLERARRTMPWLTPEDVRRLTFAFLAVQDPLDVPSPRKYIRVQRHLPWGEMRLEGEELYDLRTDPGEERNLLGPSASPEDRAAALRLRGLGE